MYKRHEAPTRPYPVLQESSFSLNEVAPANDEYGRATTVDDEAGEFGSSLSTTLPMSAQQAYELMCQSERSSEWMAVLRSSNVLSSYLDGRPECVAFIGNLKRASVGYTLHYTYLDDQNKLLWSTAAGAQTVIAGSAAFQELGPNACMLHYEIELNKHSSLPPWADDMYNGHPASSILSDFREFVRRTKEANSCTAT